MVGNYPASLADPDCFPKRLELALVINIQVVNNMLCQWVGDGQLFAFAFIGQQVLDNICNSVCGLALEDAIGKCNDTILPAARIVLTRNLCCQPLKKWKRQK